MGAWLKIKPLFSADLLMARLKALERDTHHNGAKRQTRSLLMGNEMAAMKEGETKPPWQSVPSVETKENWIKELFDVKDDEQMKVWGKDDGSYALLELDGAEYKEVEDVDVGTTNSRFQYYSMKSYNNRNIIEEKIHEKMCKWPPFRVEANSMGHKFVLDAPEWKEKVHEMWEVIKRKGATEKDYDKFMEDNNLSGAELLICPPASLWCEMKVTKSEHQAVGYMMDIWNKFALILSHFGSTKLQNRILIRNLQEWMIPEYMKVPEKESVLLYFTLPLIVLRLSMRALLRYPMRTAVVYIKSVLNLFETKIETELVNLKRKRSPLNQKRLRQDCKVEGKAQKYLNCLVTHIR